jgi:hypothetical protein
MIMKYNVDDSTNSRMMSLANQDGEVIHKV